jgi:hypothetical protein
VPIHNTTRHTLIGPDVGGGITAFNSHSSTGPSAASPGNRPISVDSGFLAGTEVVDLLWGGNASDSCSCDSLAISANNEASFCRVLVVYRTTVREWPFGWLRQTKNLIRPIASEAAGIAPMFCRNLNMLQQMLNVRKHFD